MAKEISRYNKTSKHASCVGAEQVFEAGEIAALSAKTYFSVKEAALYIGISQRKLRDMLSRRLLRQVRLGGRVIIRREDIDKYLDTLAD